MRTRRVLAPRMAAMNQPRATLIYGKPPKDPIGVAVSCFIVYTPPPLGFMPDVISFFSFYQNKTCLCFRKPPLCWLWWQWLSSVLLVTYSPNWMITKHKTDATDRAPQHPLFDLNFLFLLLMPIKHFKATRNQVLNSSVVLLFCHQRAVVSSVSFLGWTPTATVSSWRSSSLGYWAKCALKSSLTPCWQSLGENGS